MQHPTLAGKPCLEQRQQAASDFADRLKCVIEGMVARGLTQRAMVDELNRLGIKTARGGEWSQVQLQRVIARLEGKALRKISK